MHKRLAALVGAACAALGLLTGLIGAVWLAVVTFLVFGPPSLVDRFLGEFDTARAPDWVALIVVGARLEDTALIVLAVSSVGFAVAAALGVVLIGVGRGMRAPEKSAALSTATFFAERRERADFEAFDRLMSRPGGATPAEDDRLD